MPLIERRALVNHSAEQMFDLVNDIESYPKFMKGCKSARVISSSENELVGELTLGQAGIEQTFTTRNTLQRPERIGMELVSGNFKSFAACWHFQCLGREASKISLNMEFEFDSGVMDLAAGKLFSRVANSQIDALVSRAEMVYGN